MVDNSSSVSFLVYPRNLLTTPSKSNLLLLVVAIKDIDVSTSQTVLRAADTDWP
jgi:hypothetical protein